MQGVGLVPALDLSYSRREDMIWREDVSSFYQSAIPKEGVFGVGAVRCHSLVEPMTESVLKIVTTASIVLPQSQNLSRGLAVTNRLHLVVSLCPIPKV